MTKSLGKKFEEKFREDFSKIQNSIVIRLPDQVSGYKATSANICDFICYVYPHIYFIECKEKKGNTFPLENLTQYERLLQVKNKLGAVVGVVIWYSEHDKVFFVPISVFEQLKAEDKKSLNIKDIHNYKNIIEIPSQKKRKFLDSDYSILLEER